MYTELSRPTIFGHRGSSAHAPENTLAAFDLAIRQGADAIELDAKLCLDGHIVVIHDQSVDRTTGATGLVRELPLADLRKLDAGSTFNPAFKGEKIPTLEEVFESVGQRTFINVELTNYASPLDNLPVKVCCLVKQFHLEERVMFSSFNPLALLRARRALPQVPRGLLAFPGSSGAWARSWPGSWFPCQALHPEFKDVSQDLVRRVHHNHRRVYVYTVNDPQDMHHLFTLEVDGIFTDDPLLARKTLESLTAQRSELNQRA
jgi:glycerophosphoryl diester phosphodiesterase